MLVNLITLQVVLLLIAKDQEVGRGELPDWPVMSGWKKPFSWHLRNDKRESGGQEAAVSRLQPDALFSAAATTLGGHHVSRDGWFPGAARARRKN